MSTEVREMEKKEAVLQQPENTRNHKVFIPRADIFENQESIVVLADMPGVDDKSVDITLDRNILTINGFVVPEAPAGYTLAYSEYAIGDYRRVFTLSNEIDRERIQARVKNGVLRLTLPKSKAVQPKKIVVKAE